MAQDRPAPAAAQQPTAARAPAPHAGIRGGGPQASPGPATSLPTQALSAPSVLALQRSIGNTATAGVVTGQRLPMVSRFFDWGETLTPRQQVDKALSSRDAGDVKDIDDFSVASEAERIDLIRIVLGQGWVGPRDEAALERIWGSFGTRVAIVGATEGGFQLWKDSIEAGAELEDLPALVRLREEFGRDVKALAGRYLAENRQYITEELQALAGGPSADAAAQAAATASLQEDARLMARAEDAQRQLRRVQVGWDWEVLDMPGGSMRSNKVPAFFQPGRPPMLAPSAEEDFARWEDVNTQYEQASDILRGLVARQPALFPAMGQGTAAQIGTATPEQARALVGGSLRTVLTNIDQTLPKLDSGDLDWRDLNPIHAQLFAGATSGNSGIPWDTSFNKWVAQQELDDHASRQFWISLGLGSLAAAAFVVANLATAGSATFFLTAAVGVGAAGLQAGMSWEQYEDLATASNTTLSDERALITSGQASAALFQAALDTVFLFLDVYGVAAKGASAAAREALEAGEKAVGERAGREAAELAERNASRTGERVTEEVLQAEAQASIRLGEASHTLKAVHRNGRMELWLCSNCARLLEQIDEVLPTMAREGDSKWAAERLSRVRDRAAALQRRIDAGEIPWSRIPGEVNQLAEQLRNLFAKFPQARGLEFFRSFRARLDYDALAHQLGFERIRATSHGQPVYRNGRRYISPDIGTDGNPHRGAVWKMAEGSEHNLRNRNTRMGSFNHDLTVKVDG